MNKISLSSVDLLAVSSIKIDETIASLQKCLSKVEFRSAKLISHKKPENLPHEISFEICSNINSIMEYNQFIFSGLGSYVEGSHVLIIQYDSYILNADLWREEWLKYDYIGAPWSWQKSSYVTDYGEHVRVGNGGFSLRSKKLLEIPKKLGLKLESRMGYFNEDGNLCVYARKKLLEQGIKYAPVEVAARFSYENEVPENKGIKTFGFHKNLPKGER